MADLDTLRPEVAQALGFIERNQKYGDGSVCAGDIDVIRAELLRLAKENADYAKHAVEQYKRGAHWMDRAKDAEAELAALKAKMKPCAQVVGGKVRVFMDPDDEGKYVAILVVEE